MTRYFSCAVAACSLFVFAGAASAQTDDDVTAPTITFDAPANGVDLSTVEDPDLFSRSKVTVSGTASDDVRVASVTYRIERSRRWRKATLIRTSDADGQLTYAWSFRMRMRKGSSRRVYVRAADDSRNESDIIGRRVRRGRR